MRRLATLAALAIMGTALLVSGLLAQTLPVGKEGGRDGNLQTIKMGAVYTADNDSGNVRRLRVNQYDHLLVSDGLRDRDHWEFKGTGYQSDSLAAKAWAKWGLAGGGGLNFVDLKDYSAATLLVSWAANADSDSVAFEIWPVAKQSGSEDGYDYIYDTDDSDSLMSGFFVGRGRWAKNLAVNNQGRISRRWYFAKPADAQISLTEYDNNTPSLPIGSARTYPMGSMNGYGVAIPLTDIAGSDMLMPICGFWVLNRHPRRPLVGLNINLWAKVK